MRIKFPYGQMKEDCHIELDVSADTYFVESQAPASYSYIGVAVIKSSEDNIPYVLYTIVAQIKYAINTM